MSNELLYHLESDYCTPRQIALQRIRLLSNVENLGDVSNVSYAHETTELIQLTPNRGGLAAIFFSLLNGCVSSFISYVDNLRCQSQCQRKILAKFNQDAICLYRLLKIYLIWVKFDPTLSEELGRQGCHQLLIQLIDFATISIVQQVQRVDENSNDEPYMLIDLIEDLQDTAGEIAALSRPHFPILSSKPFTTTDLQQRLPIVFTLPYYNENTAISQLHKHSINEESAIAILVHQITNRQAAQEDVGFVIWPSAVVLALLMLRDKINIYCCKSVEGSSSVSILELGAGCGLSGLVVARYNQRLVRMSEKSSNLKALPINITFTDFNLRVLSNIQRNIDLNNLSGHCSVMGLDFYKQTGKSITGWISIDGVKRDPVDIVIAADIICQPSDATAVAKTINDVLKPGGTAYVICADAKHRFGVDRLSIECIGVGLTVFTEDICYDHESTDTPIDAILLSESDQRMLEETTGYVQGMKLILFTIGKKFGDKAL